MFSAHQLYDGKAALTVSQPTNHLPQLDIIDNWWNINARNLANEGLHLNPTDTSRHAKNLLSPIKSVWKAKWCPGIINDNNIEPEQISPSLDLLLVSETNLDDSFPTTQFLMSGFCKPYRLDRCSNGEGLLLYIWEDIPSRLPTECNLSENVECLFVEINIRKKKLLLCCSYNPHKNNISKHLHHLNKGLDVYLKHYDNLLILGDLNSDLKDSCLNAFSNVNNLKSLNKKIGLL